MTWQKVVLLLGVFATIVVSALLLDAGLAAAIIGTVTVLYREVDHSLGARALVEVDSSSVTPPSAVPSPPSTGSKYIGTTLILLLMMILPSCAGAPTVTDPEFSGSVEGSTDGTAYSGEVNAVLEYADLEATVAAGADISPTQQLIKTRLSADYLGVLEVHATVLWDLGCEVATVCIGFSTFESCFDMGESVCVPAGPVEPVEGG